MTRSVRLIVAVVALLAAASSTAGATTWHSSGDTTFTATSGPTTLTTNLVGGFFSGITCTGGIDVSGTSVAGTTAALIGRPITGTLSFTGCTTLSNPAGVDCAYRFTPLTETGGTTTGLFDTTCSVTLTGTAVCHAEGGLLGTYFNPSGGVAGRFTVRPGALTLTNSGVPNTACPYNSGTPSPLGFHETTLSITAAAGGPAPHTGPVLTRTV